MKRPTEATPEILALADAQAVLRICEHCLSRPGLSDAERAAARQEIRDCLERLGLLLKPGQASGQPRPGGTRSSPETDTEIFQPNV